MSGGQFTGQNTARAIARNAIIGAFEGVGGYFAAGLAIKVFTRFASKIGPELAKELIAKILKAGSKVPGTSLTTQLIIETEVGTLRLSSGHAGDAATGALKHILNDVLKKAGPTANTELAELLAVKELEAAAVLATQTGFALGKNVIFRTSYAEWELVLDVADDGVLKLYHAMPFHFF